MMDPRHAASRTPASPRRCGPHSDNGNRRQLQRHPQRITLHEAIATQRAAAGLLGEVVEERRRTCGATRELARIAALARLVYDELAALAATEGGAQ
jgi:hypothetical protein